MKSVLRSGLTVFRLMVMLHVACVLFLTLLTSENPLVSLISSLVVLLIYFVLGYADGAANGEKAVAYAHTMEKTAERRGEPLTDLEQQQCYAPWKGFATSAAAAVYMLIVTALLTLGFIIALGLGFPESLRMAVGLCMLPYVGLVAAAGNGFVWLYAFGYILFPAVVALSYLTGPARHAKLLETVAGARSVYEKKQRRERARRKETVAAPVRRPGKKELR